MTVSVGASHLRANTPCVVDPLTGLAACSLSLTPEWVADALRSARSPRGQGAARSAAVAVWLQLRERVVLVAADVPLDVTGQHETGHQEQLTGLLVLVERAQLVNVPAITGPADEAAHVSSTHSALNTQH